jgi:ubiquinone/menaquinone biosynthesis C-methylase UbiE
VEEKDHYKKVEEFHNRNAADYDGIRYGDASVTQVSYLTRRDITCGMMSSAKGRILDVGCGPGPFVERMMRDDRKLFTVDISANMVSEARKRQTDAGNVLHGFASNLVQLGIEDRTFDGVICIGVIGYIQEPLHAFQEIYRVMKPGATAVIQTSNSRSIKEFLYEKCVPRIKRLFGKKQTSSYGFNFDLRSYGKGAFDRLLREAGFEIVDWRYYNFHIPFLERISRRFAIRMALALQRFGRSRLLGFLGGGYLVNVRKAPPPPTDA